MNFEFHPEAEKEFLEAVDYYEQCESGLGYDFFLEIRATVDLILAYPMAWPILDDEIRRGLTNRFPYSIESTRIYIIAVMQLHRAPGYWKDRL